MKAERVSMCADSGRGVMYVWVKERDGNVEDKRLWKKVGVSETATEIERLHLRL